MGKQKFGEEASFEMRARVFDPVASDARRLAAQKLRNLNGRKQVARLDEMSRTRNHFVIVDCARVNGVVRRVGPRQVDGKKRLQPRGRVFCKTAAGFVDCGCSSRKFVNLQSIFAPSKSL